MAGRPILLDMRGLLLSAMLMAYAIYATSDLRPRRRRCLRFGGFFSYSLCCAAGFWSSSPECRCSPAIGTGSYFIYLWHIFIVMALRDHAALRGFGPILNAARDVGVTVLLSVAALW